MTDTHTPEIDAHDSRCFQVTGTPDDLPNDLCDCRTWRAIDDANTPPHGYGDTSDCLCGRNFSTVRGLREHLTKARLRTVEGAS